MVKSCWSGWWVEREIASLKCGGGPYRSRHSLRKNSEVEASHDLWRWSKRPDLAESRAAATLEWAISQWSGRGPADSSRARSDLLPPRVRSSTRPSRAPATSAASTGD